jgi:hypothetical protein
MGMTMPFSFTFVVQQIMYQISNILFPSPRIRVSAVKFIPELRLPDKLFWTRQK